MKKNVYIQYNCVAHYRARIFELLSKNNDYNFEILADKNADTPFMATIDDLDGRKIKQVHAKTYQFAINKLPIIYFQPYAVLKIVKDMPDLIVSLGSPYSITAWFLVLYGRLTRTPVLLWGHGLLGNEKGLKWIIRKIFYNLASGQLLYGEYAKDLLVAKNFNPDTLHVVYNSLDYDNQLRIYDKLTDEMRSEFRATLGLTVDDRLIVFTGRLQPIKRLDMIVDALAILKERNYRVHVVFVGEGHEKENLHTLSVKNDVEKQVHFLGASYDESYLGLVLGSSNLCVIPSGAGLSIMHSMIFGTPVLIHDDVTNHFPEWEAVIDGETGLFYRYDDLTDLADKIQQAMYPEPIKNKMNKSCIKIIKKKYNPHKQEKIIVDAIKQYIG